MREMVCTVVSVRTSCPLAAVGLHDINVAAGGKRWRLKGTGSDYHSTMPRDGSSMREGGSSARVLYSVVQGGGHGFHCSHHVHHVWGQ